MGIIKEIVSTATRSGVNNLYQVVNFTGWYMIECLRPFKLDIQRQGKPSTTIAIGFSGGAYGLITYETGVAVTPVVSVFNADGVIMDFNTQTDNFGAHATVWLEAGDEFSCSSVVNATEAIQNCYITYIGEHEIHVGLNRRFYGPVSQTRKP